MCSAPCLEGFVAKGSSSLQLPKGTSVKPVGHSLIMCRFQDIAWQSGFLSVSNRPRTTESLSQLVPAAAAVRWTLGNLLAAVRDTAD